MTDSDLDAILEMQLAVAWAGEAETSPRRLGWWRTAMCDEYGGEDLLRRLAPKTWEWAVLECCRAAAKRVDDRARRAADDADLLVSLFRLGFELDDRLDSRLRELKVGGVSPRDVFPSLGELVSEWSPDRFARWLAAHGTADYTTTATGRRLRGEPGANPSETVARLTAALAPCSAGYALPHYRIRK
jgi:hypothetical protein